MGAAVTVASGADIEVGVAVGVGPSVAVAVAVGAGVAVSLSAVGSAGDLDEPDPKLPESHPRRAARSNRAHRIVSLLVISAFHSKP